MSFKKYKKKFIDSIRENGKNKIKEEKIGVIHAMPLAYVNSSYGVFSNPVSQNVEDKFARQQIVRGAYKVVLQDLLESLATANLKSMKI